MKRYMHKIKGLTFGLLACGLAFTSCSEEVDDANLFTFTGQYIKDFINDSEEHPELSSFAAIVEKAGLNSMLAGYGTYTCFAPTNEAVDKYIDSLYKDTDAVIPHNGLTDNSLEGLLNGEKADSLCQDIAKYHVAGTEMMTIDMGSVEISKPLRMMNGRDVTTQMSSAGNMLLNRNVQLAALNADKEVENGVVHIVGGVLTRSQRNVVEELDQAGNYKVFMKALHETGLDTLIINTVTSRTEGVTFFDDGATKDPQYPYGEYPTECLQGYTIFAEPDEVLGSFENLVQLANNAYQNCASWYDHVREDGITVSTGTDYTNPWNALNMFVRYHIVPYAVRTSDLVYTYNEKSTLDVYEYYRTLLPYTMLKVIGTKSVGGEVDHLYINRSYANASLSEVPAGEYDPNFHSVVNSGVSINSSNSFEASNGYIHPLQSVLTYNSDVPQKVLNERIRMDFTALMDEMMTNKFRGASGQEVASAFGRSSASYAIRMPVGYVKNMEIYAGDVTRISYLTKDECKYFGYSEDCWNDYQGDELYVKGAFDFAFKLPPVPQSGTYELRFGYVNNGQRGIVQFYIGTSSKKGDMEACDIPMNQNLSMTDPLIGWTDASKESDNGAATDRAMRNRGYMRGPDYFSKYKKGNNKSARYFKGNGQDHVRRIVVKRYFKQGQEYWLRMKTALPENTEAEYEVDYFELVPKNIYDNPTLTEDIY